MPWVKKEMCTGCGECLTNCSTDAISMDENVAYIDESECIRCGVCHTVCPNDAVRHDGERIPEEVDTNIAWASKLLSHDYYSNDEEKQKELSTRLKRYFIKNIKVAEKTIERLHDLQ